MGVRLRVPGTLEALEEGKEMQNGGDTLIKVRDKHGYPESMQPTTDPGQKQLVI